MERLNILKPLILLLLMCTGCGFSASAQLIKNVSRLEKKADEYYGDGKYTQAIIIYKEAIERDPSNIESKIKIAECFRLMDKTEESERWYRLILENDANLENHNPEYKYYFALVLESNGKYDEARDWFELYRKVVPEDRRVIDKLESLSNLSRHYQDSSSYEVDRLFINTTNEEFGTVMYKNGILFTSDRLPPDNNFGSVFTGNDSLSLSRFYFADKLPNGSFGSPVQFDESLNVGYNEGTINFYNESNSMVYTRATRPGLQARKFELFFAEKDRNSDNWVNQRAFPFNSRSGEYSIIHPTISEDGKMLIFASDMPGGFGSYDLYICEKDFEDKWTEPINLGEKINTRDTEYFPFLFKNNILFFASRGHGGLGGLDIYQVDLSNSALEVKNLGFPINTNKNDYGLCLDAQGYSGYLSSDRDGGSGLSDIYSFNRKIYINGLVADLDSKQPVSAVSVILRHNRTKTIVGIETTEGGRYRVKLEPNTTYELQAFKNGYEFTNPRRVTTYGVEDINNLDLFLKKQDLICKGFVSDQQTGQPLAGVEVSLINSRSGYTQTIKTIEDGSYIFMVCV